MIFTKDNSLIKEINGDDLLDEDSFYLLSKDKDTSHSVSSTPRGQK
jgi:hypothetical protein